MRPNASAAHPATDRAAGEPLRWHRGHVVLSALCLVVVGVVAYHNSFSGAFLFDDQPHIVENARLRRLWPPQDVIGRSPRPVVELTFAVNYALGGLDVRGYHVVNLAIHLLAALVLFGIVRRTLMGPTLRARYGQASGGLALTAALLWMVHPIQTQAVTYVIQRAESLMGLWYLLTVYSVIRGSPSPHRGLWYTAAVGSCALGMATKAAMVTVPVLVLVYDRIFLARSWREILLARAALYVGFAATWVLLAVLVVPVLGIPDGSIGLGMKGVTPAAYALTQPGVIVRYLGLSVWPHPLVFDYDWPLASSVQAMMAPSLILGALLLLTAWALWRHPGWGFLGAWFFITLAPGSSVIPIAVPAAEYRMYLPLAGVVGLLVLGGWDWLQRCIPSARGRGGLACSLVGAVVVLLGTLTVRRNEDYRSALAMWRDTVAKRPANARARYTLGNLLLREGKLDEALGHYTEAIRLKPDDPKAHHNYAVALAGLGQVQGAQAQYAEAIRLEPDFPEAHANVGELLLRQGRFEDAAAALLRAIRLKPDVAPAHRQLGNVYASQGKLEEAIAQYTESLRLQPDDAQAHNNLGAVLMAQGRLDPAIAHYAEALRLAPDFIKAHQNLGVALARQGKLEEAAAAFARVLRLDPTHPDARRHLDRIHEAMRPETRPEASDPSL